ncbi:MAG: hypothetical protein Q4G06_12070, partial [Clostridia bacterium]|nr:hypothetical protein [Clostridia bacterium]
EPTATEEPSATEEPAVTEEPAAGIVIGAPVLDIQPNTGSVEAQITDADGNEQTVNLLLVGEGTLQLTWSAEGEISGYDVTILNAAGVAMVNQPMMSGAGASIDSSYLTPDEIYSLTVTAHASADDSVTTASTLYFARPAAEPAPASEMETESEPATEPEPAADPEPVTEPEPEAEPVTIGAPVLDIQPNQGSSDMDVGGFTAPVYAVGDGVIQLSWLSDGDIAGYNVRVLDANGNVMVDQNLSSTSATISSDYLTAGMVYSLNVTAYASADSNVTTSATLYFTYVPAPAAEPETVEPEYTEPEPEYT